MDPLHHADLTSVETVSALPLLTRAVDEVCSGEQPLVVLAALTAQFVTTCHYLDVDASAAFEQVADAIAAGELDPQCARLSAGDRVHTDDGVAVLRLRRPRIVKN